MIQRREDGSVNFFRDWEAYREGFGKITGEHWLGKPSMSLSVIQSVWKKGFSNISVTKRFIECFQRVFLLIPESLQIFQTMFSCMQL